MKKKLATKTLVVVTPLHSIRLNESVVSVVPNAPSANADYTNCQLYFRLEYIMIWNLHQRRGTLEVQSLGHLVCLVVRYPLTLSLYK